MTEFGFNALLRNDGINPAHVRLLRHETSYSGNTPYLLWRDDRSGFEKYQRVQRADRRSYFASPIWASFVVTPDQLTLFVGLYRSAIIDRVPDSWEDPLAKRPHDWSQYDLYEPNPWTNCAG